MLLRALGGQRGAGGKKTPELVARYFVLVPKSFSRVSDPYGLEFDFILNHSEEQKAGRQQDSQPDTESNTQDTECKITSSR
jgi:hypothetical protein